MCSTKNFLSMLHVWLITCWKWWIFTFPAEYINSTLGHSSNQIFLDPIIFSGCQIISQLLAVKKTKPKKSPICVYSRWKKMCAIAHIGNTSAKTILFLIYSIRTRTRSRTWTRARTWTRKGMVTAELSTGRMHDPQVGSGRVTILLDFGGSGRPGRVSTSDLSVFYWLFLGTWIDMNLRILHSDWLIFIDIQYIIII